MSIDWKQLINLPIHERNRIWLECKNKKIKAKNSQKRDKQLDGCTFNPQIYTRKTSALYKNSPKNMRKRKRSKSKKKNNEFVQFNKRKNSAWNRDIQNNSYSLQYKIKKSLIAEKNKMSFSKNRPRKSLPASARNERHAQQQYCSEKANSSFID